MKFKSIAKQFFIFKVIVMIIMIELSNLHNSFSIMKVGWFVASYKIKFINM